MRYFLAAALLCFLPLQVWAACSPYLGLAVINEVSKEQQNPTNQNQGDSADDFVEVKMLDNSIPASTYQNWTIEICENSGDGCSTVSLSTANVTGYPWLVMNDLLTIGRHLNLALGTYIYLYDENGDVVDYLSAGGFNSNPLPSCDFLYDTTATTGNKSRRVQRMPDGTGDWDEPPGNSSPPTDSDTNDDDVPADAPSLTINDVTVAAGNNLVFTLTLSAAYDDDVTVNYQTYDNTAEAGTDYVAASGTVTIPQGSTTTTVTVSSLVGGGGSFYLLLSAATNASITDQAGKGVIIPDPLAEWRFDEYGWTGASGEVLDSSGNSLHGTANSAASTDTNPAISGSPGTCYYGEFDGVDDYVSVPDNNLLDLSDELTVTAWVRPQSGTTGTDTILSKGGAGDFSYSLRLTASQNLEFTWCTANSGGNCSSSETVVSVGSLPLDQWSHVAVSFSTTVQRLYINGNQDGVAALTSPIVANGSSLYIGSSANSDHFFGGVDEVRVYDFALDGLLIGAIMNETRVCAPAVFDHYHISFDGGATASDSSAITCEAATVTITAHSATHLGTVIPSAGTSINLSTSTGVGYWSLPTAGSVVDGGNGTAVYTFDGTQQSSSLQFNHTIPALNPNPVNININGGTGEDPTEDPNLQFFESGFRFVDGADVAIIGNQIAAQASAVHYLQAVRTDTQTGACVGAFADGQQVSVQLAAECNNPSTCAGQQVILSSNAATGAIATSADNATAGAAAYSSFDLLFGPDSKAAFTLNYPDVGAISLHARHQLRNEDGTLSNDFMIGSSNSLVVAPASFAITAITDAAGVANPGSTTTGSGFTAAGEAFRVVVEARNALGNLTPNYGNESTPESIRIHLDSLVFPVGGSSGILTGAAGFVATGSAGEFENNGISFSEAGSIAIYASVADGDYLGAGDVTSPTSGAVGRFYPAEFRLASSSVTNSCPLGPFSYMSEPAIGINYLVEAHRSGGGVLQNYDSTDLNYPTASYSLHAEDSNDGNDLGARLFAAGTGWNDGVLSASDPSARFARDTSPDGPYSNMRLGIRLVDLDGADFDTLDFKADGNNDCGVDGNCNARALSGALDARFGRLYLQDAHGPESSPIPMVWQAEYWNGESFALNADDHCTELPLAAVNFVGASTTVDDVNDVIQVDLGGVVSNFDFSDPLGSSDCLTATDIRICDGKAGIAYGAPGAIVTYPISVNLSGLPWLQSDWNQDGAFTDNPFPLVNIRFQHYRGHDRVIYWREVFD